MKDPEARAIAVGAAFLSVILAFIIGADHVRASQWTALAHVIFPAPPPISGSYP